MFTSLMNDIRSRISISDEAHMNFQTSYLQTIFRIMGVDDIEIISLNNEEYGGERFAKSQQEVYQKIASLK